MSDRSAYVKVTLSKGKLFTGRLREKGTVMSLPLDAARRMIEDGEAEYYTEEKKKRVVTKKKKKEID